MKKRKSILAAALLGTALLVSGCSMPEFPMAATYSPKPEKEPEVVSTVMPVTPEAVCTPAVIQKESAESSQLFVSFSETLEEYCMPKKQGGEKICEFSYRTPYVRSGDGKDYSELNENLAIYDELFYSGSEEDPGVNYYHEAALDAYSYVGTSYIKVSFPFYSHRTVAPERVDDTCLSLLYSTSSYIGAGESFKQIAMNYEPESGKLLNLDDVADVGRLYSLFNENYRSYGELPLNLIQKSFKEDPSSMIREGHWYLTNDSFVVFADSSEIAGDGYGIISFQIPLAGNESVFKAAPKTVQKTGELVLASKLEDGSTDIRDFVRCGDGIDVFLKAEGTVYDLAVNSVVYSDGEFYVTDILWKCGALTDSALQLRLVIPEGVPDTMITYTAPDGTRCEKLIAESGADGSLLLIDNISTVG